MKEFKKIKEALWFAAVFVFLGIFQYLPFTTQKAYAVSISEELLQKAFEEEYGSMEDLGELENVPDDYENEDLYELTDQYLEMFQNGDYSIETIQEAIIENPHMQMSMTDDGRVRYMLPNGDSYTATVPNGMITSSPVTISPSTQVASVVTKDGESSHIFNKWNYTEPGNYQIQMLFISLESDNYEDIQAYEVTHYFTIVGRKSNRIGAVPAPEGFEIISVKKDGLPQPVENSRCVFLEGDGVFEIRYYDTKTRSIYTATSFERDTAAPFLDFSEDIEHGPVKGPVEFYKSDLRDQIYLYYNGNSSLIDRSSLSAEGKYTLKVVDEVGNSRLYNLEIKRSYGILETKTIILALIFLLGAGIDFFLFKRDMEAM